MKIAFSKVNSTACPFKLNLKNVVFEGDMIRIDSKLVKINAIMQGFIYRPCDRCGEDIKLDIKENLELFASDGIFKDNENKLSDTIEFFDGQINLTELAFSELEAYLSAYFYCEDCSDKN